MTVLISGLFILFCIGVWWLIDRRGGGVDDSIERRDD